MDRLALILISFAFIVIFALSGVAQASPFINGSFDSGYTGWSGSFVEPFTVIDPGTTSPQFSLQSNSSAQLLNNDTDWIVTLFQDFCVDSLTAPINKLNLNFSIRWQPTESGLDSVSATLGGIDLLADTTLSQLLAGVDLSVDVTSLAGSEAELGFTIMDSDFLAADFLWVDNIVFNQMAPDTAPVPEPGTVFLLTAGVIGIAFAKRLKKAIL